jgi:hypothetical protein
MPWQLYLLLFRMKRMTDSHPFIAGYKPNLYRKIYQIILKISSNLTPIQVRSRQIYATGLVSQGLDFRIDSHYTVLARHGQAAGELCSQDFGMQKIYKWRTFDWKTDRVNRRI